MSIRNQYARNYFKVAPIPSNSNEITNARNAARRRNLYQNTIGTDVKPRQIPVKQQVVRQPWDLSQPRSPPKRPIYNFHKEISDADGITGTRIYDKTANRKYGSLSEKTRLKVIAARENRRDSLTFIADPKRKDNLNVRTTSKSEIDIRHNEYAVRQDTSDVVQDDEDVRQSDEDVKHHRPMSARPESRWTRRTGDEEEDNSNSDDDDLNNSRDTDLSDSPDTTDNADEFQPDVALSVSSRPKTGHVRKNGFENKPVSTSPEQGSNKVKYDRPKSRVGNRGIPKWTGAQTFPKKYNRKQENRENIPYNPYIGYDYVRSHTSSDEIDYDIGINVFYPEARNRLCGADDINSQIDDIDKNVDPVLFFMRNDDPIPIRVEKKRPSLSKDTINHINSEKNAMQNQNKNHYGLLDNTQNKCHSAPEKIDRFHRNKNQSLQNTITETNQHSTYSWKKDKITNNAHERGGKLINKTRPIVDSNIQSKRVDYEPSKQHIREYVTVPHRRSLDYDEDKTRSFIYGRKPRKLLPLVASNSDE